LSSVILEGSVKTCHHPPEAMSEGSSREVKKRPSVGISQSTAITTSRMCTGSVPTTRRMRAARPSRGVSASLRRGVSASPRRGVWPLVSRAGRGAPACSGVVAITPPF